MIHKIKGMYLSKTQTYPFSVQDKSGKRKQLEVRHGRAGWTGQDGVGWENSHEKY